MRRDAEIPGGVQWAVAHDFLSEAEGLCWPAHPIKRKAEKSSRVSAARVEGHRLFALRDGLIELALHKVNRA